MKKFLPVVILIAANLLSGCAWVKHHSARHPATATVKPAPVAPQTIVMPDDSLAAKVIRVNTVGRFVVLNFPEGQLPKPEQHLFLFRNGMKVAEVKISGQTSETLIVADLISGEAQVGDAVHDQ